MIRGKKVIVILPAYNAEKTLEMTYGEIPFDIVDDVLLVDDASSDKTADMAKSLGIKTIVHPENKGYGGNQKTCYREALKLGADIVIMLHPDYQYTPKLIPAMAYLIESGEFDAVLGSRILSGGALKGGMPFYKYLSNRLLTLIQNILLRQKLSEYHTGYRAFKKEILERLPLEENSDDFVFDNQMLSQIIYFGYKVGEISCPAKYFPEASSINFRRSIKYGLGVLLTSIKFSLQRTGIFEFSIFSKK
ncbi:MAG: glycosyltransferase family 2 protein [Thermodesulfovibrionales bacterium]